MDTEDDDLGDWRIEVATRLAQDLPAAFPGGPSHKAGDPVRKETQTKGPDGRPLGFITPSTTALALNLALRAATQATDRRTRLRFQKMATPEGRGAGVDPADLPDLFDCFESCMVCVAFCFQALEAYANGLISKHVTGTYVLRRKKRRLVLKADELERQASTEEKLATVLPDLTRIKSPKGSKRWQNFVELKRIRDATIHLKSGDQYPHRPGEPPLDERSLFYRCLNDDLMQYVDNALDMIEYFAAADQPRWLRHARERVNGATRKP